MSPQNVRRGYCAKYIQPDSRYGQKVVPVHNIPAVPIPAVSAVCIWRNILVFHFAGSSIYTSFIYGSPDEGYFYLLPIFWALAFPMPIG